ncbi:MAG TPA: Hsp20/alpha crystallin family protein [Caulobacteraceae bacterium]|jgi:HSP20 family protein
MAENLESQSNPQTGSGDKSSQSKAGDRTVESERRSFADNGDGASQAVTIAKRAAAEAQHEMADLWRAPFNSLPALQMEMSRMFDDFWRGAMGLGGLTTMRASRPLGGVSAATLFGHPAVDVTETERAYLLAIEVPGMAVADLSLSLDGDNLVISGHKAEEREDATTSYRVSERRYGRFERRFPIEPDVNREAIEATYRDGVLRISLPRKASAVAKRSKIQIKT